VPAFPKVGTLFVMMMFKKLKSKFTTMSKEKEIKIEDGNVKEQVQNEQVSNAEEQNAATSEKTADEETEDKADTAADKKAEGEDTADKKAEEVELNPLEQVQKEVEELKKQLLYKTAEFENYRKRTLKEKTELILNGGEKTITAILPVLDDFERAIADKSEDPKAIKEGMQMIFNKFAKALEGLGVKKIETTDKDFDTDFHEAIAMVPGMGDDKKGKVIDCVQAGYTLNDKVIRHAKVAVGQ
jgi:molecular chaperone GrpE